MQTAYNFSYVNDERLQILYMSICIVLAYTSDKKAWKTAAVYVNMSNEAKWSVIYLLCKYKIYSF